MNQKQSFYNKRYHEWHVNHTKYIEPSFSWFLRNYQVNSVVDFGCGIGSYLKTALQHNCTVKGYDISESAKQFTDPVVQPFIEYRDCTEPINAGRFDLAISIETIEHVANWKGLLDNLTKASNWLLFSGADVGQAGSGHINCQPKSFWLDEFEKRGYEINHAYRNAKVVWKPIVPDYLYNNFLILSKRLDKMKN